MSHLYRGDGHESTPSWVLYAKLEAVYNHPMNLAVGACL